MNNPVHAHALKYATEATKAHLMQEYKSKFPHYFQNARIETRPATNEDYFIPPSIADKCIVVVKTQFDEIGCKRLSCFQFKKNWEVCEKTDPLQWVRIGDDYELACQKSCQDHSINTEWSKDGRCIIANPLKKVLASIPEKLFERASRHVFHGGFDVIEGDLKINKRYCDAYGLDFVDGDCVASGGQQFGEFLFGKTTIRAAKAANLEELKDIPPPIPSYMNYTIRKRKRVKRSLSIDDSPTSSQIIKEFAADLAKDVGLDVSEYAIKRFLKRKAPALLTKGIDKIATKLVLKNSLVVGLKQLGTLALKMAGSAAGVVTAIYALYDLVVGIIDIVDPFDYMKVIDKEKLEKIDDQLDYTYYQDGPVRSEMTPEYIWENELLIDDKDIENQLLYMTMKVEEYLKALETIPENEFHKQTQMSKQKPLIQFVWKEKEDVSKTFFKCIIFVMVCCALLFLEWIHIWACCLFFAMLYYKPYFLENLY